MIIFGLYFYPESTKGLIKVTGKAIVGAVKEITSSKEYNEIKENVTKNITRIVKNGS
jgi:hypothetical protein